MSGHVLVLGGARSGKTGFAETLAMRAGESPLYLATAQALDTEMLERANALRSAAGQHDVILVDCLTLWITNLLGANQNVAAAVDELADALGEIEAARIILVSNEVGLGIVPDNPLARTFRDLAGSTHQRLAEICSEVHFVIAGLPMTLKGPRLTGSTTELPRAE
jgi:adenosylcobinamide kinase/adenosylcobinamide-phosphate guanylyltransferase